jgi:hypothetical protein
MSRQKKRIAGGLLAVALIPTLCAHAGDWRPLFDGKSLDGWTVKAKPADAAKGFWRVEDGAILADSMASTNHDYVWLVKRDVFTNFEFRCEFQAFRDSPGNSGVQFRSRYDDEKFWLDGPQIDIHPPGWWRTGMIWDETRGVKRWLFPVVAPGKWVDKSQAPTNMVWRYADEGTGWNTFVLRAQGTKIEAELNGVRVTDFDGAGVLDDAPHREHNTGLAGHLALQIHTRDRLRIKYRALEVRTLE